MKLIIALLLVLGSLNIYAEKKPRIKPYIVVPDSYSDIFLFENIPTRTGKIRTLRLKITTQKESIARIKAQKSKIMSVMKLVFAEEKKESFRKVEKRKEMEAKLKPMISRIAKVKVIESLEFLPLY